MEVIRYSLIFTVCVIVLFVTQVKILHADESPSSSAAEQEETFDDLEELDEPCIKYAWYGEKPISAKEMPRFSDSIEKLRESNGTVDC